MINEKICECVYNVPYHCIHFLEQHPKTEHIRKSIQALAKQSCIKCNGTGLVIARRK